MKVKSYKDLARHFVKDLMGGTVVSEYGRFSFDPTYIHGFIKAIQLDENDMEEIQAQVKKGLGVR